MSPITKPTSARIPFTVGVALEGAGWHPAAWRESGARADELFTAGYWQDLADIADSAGIDYVTIEDALHPQRATIPGAEKAGADHTAPQHIDHLAVAGRLDALLTASWIAPRTRRISVIPTVTTTHTEPFHVATALQTLDHVSEGRAGWQLRFSPDADAAAAFGRKPAPEIDIDAVTSGTPDAGLDELIGEAADVVEVSRRLWDSWEDDAVIRDAKTGRFLDRERVHHIEFEGDRFSVVGPSIVPRSPQGQLPVALLAHSAPVIRLAAATADVVFITPENPSARAGASRGASVAELVAQVRETETREDRAARGLLPLRIIADAVVALDAEPLGTEELGSDRLSSERLGSQRLSRLNALAGAPFESDAAILAGSAAEIADTIAEWSAAGIDGIRLRPLALPTDLETIAAELLPLLRDRGIAQEATLEPASLRERFALGAAGNRYAASTDDSNAERAERLHEGVTA